MELAVRCCNNSIEELFFCGDFFHVHNTINTDVLFLANRAIEYIAINNINHHMLVGNHDISRSFKKDYNNRVLLEPNSISIFNKKAHIYSSPYVCKLINNEYYASFVPYIENKDLLLDILDKISKVDTGKFKHFLFMHQGVSNVPIGSGFILNEFLSPDMIPDNVTRAFVGHYHVHRDLGKLVIVGPPMQHTRADKYEQGGCLFVDASTGEFTRELVYKNSKFVELTEDFVELSLKMGKENELKNLVNFNFVRVLDFKGNMENAETIKELLITKFDAEFVDFQFNEDSKSKENEKPSDTSLSIEQLISEYNNGLFPREQEVGALLREGKYAIPKL